jgi:uncharacterized protein YvpB
MATVAGSLVTGPAPAHETAVAVTLPDTGTGGRGDLLQELRNGPERSAPIAVYEYAPVLTYEKYVPPPPPDPAPVYQAPRWAPSDTVLIPVPIYRQIWSLDCETASLQMALATFGNYYSQQALFAYEAPDTRPPVMDANHNIVQWANPYTNFVGQVNGNLNTPTGYGIYYPVILSIARSHGVPNAIGGEGFSASTVYAALRAGHPVEVWVEWNWVSRPVRYYTAWDGRRIRYELLAHVVVLSGISSWGVRVNDPLSGTQYWVSKGTFEWVWQDLNNMAIIFQ